MYGCAWVHGCTEDMSVYKREGMDVWVHKCVWVSEHECMGARGKSRYRAVVAIAVVCGYSDV